MKVQHHVVVSLAGIASLALVGTVHAEIDNLVIFGDSLSDVGNISNATLGAVPGPFYFDGRISNGPVYTETLNAGLGFGTLTPSTEGGDDFAYGGARTFGTGGLSGLVIDDIDEQVDTFLATRTADADTLYLVFAGSNDLVALLGGESVNLSASVASLAGDLDRLYTAGARQFFVANLPDFSQVPRYNGSATAQNASTQFNTLLAAALDDFESTNTDASLIRYDTEAAFDAIIADPAAFGLTNVTDPAAPGLQIGDVFYDTSNIVSNPDEYLFWDKLHPTRTGHTLLGNAMLAAIPEPSVGTLALVMIAGASLRRRRA